MIVKGIVLEVIETGEGFSKVIVHDEEIQNSYVLNIKPGIEKPSVGSLCYFSVFAKAYDKTVDEGKRIIHQQLKVKSFKAVE